MSWKRLYLLIQIVCKAEMKREREATEKLATKFSIVQQMAWAKVLPLFTGSTRNWRYKKTREKHPAHTHKRQSHKKWEHSHLLLASFFLLLAIRVCVCVSLENVVAYPFTYVTIAVCNSAAHYFLQRVCFSLLLFFSSLAISFITLGDGTMQRTVKTILNMRYYLNFALCLSDSFQWKKNVLRKKKKRSWCTLRRI